MEQQKEEDNLILPPGFRFHPTDEEIITCYLFEKVADPSFTAVAMGEVDLNKCEPWDLPSKAKMGEKEWYFFCQRERRYPTGMRTNRATESGYWKATGKDKEIYKGRGVLVGMKKTLVFYKGRAPKGEKTNWVMHEYRLEGNYFRSRDDWVVVRIFHKNEASTTKQNPLLSTEESNAMDEDNQQNFGSSHLFGHLGSSSLGYFHPHDTVVANASTSLSPFVGQRKQEQFSNSMMSTSRETGVSNETSSYDHDGLSSEPLFDLENIWNY